MLLRVVLELGDEVGATLVRVVQHDPGLHELAAILVRDADDGALLHCGVSRQRVLDLLGADPVARRVDDVVGAARVEDVAVVVDLDVVAGREPRPNRRDGPARDSVRSGSSR